MTDRSMPSDPNSVRVLLIEDNPGDARLIREFLAEGMPDAELDVADRLDQGLDLCRSGQADIILLDLSLPDSQELDTVIQLKTNCGSTPIVVLTGLADDQVALESLQLGAQDFLEKGRLDPHLLQRTIRYAIERQKLAEEILQRESMVDSIVTSSLDGLLVIDAETVIRFANPAAEGILQQPAGQLIGMEFGLLSGGTGKDELFVVREDGTRGTIEIRYSDIQWRGESMILVALRDVTDQRRAEEALERRVEMLSALYDGARALSEHLDGAQLAEAMVRTVVEVFRARFAWVVRQRGDSRLEPLAHFPPRENFRRAWPDAWEAKRPADCSLAIATDRQQSGIHNNPLENEADCVCADLVGIPGIQSCASFPLISRQKTLGTLVVYSDERDFFAEGLMEFLRSYVNLAAAALENAELLVRTERQLEHLAALRNIDMAISSSLDLRVTLDVILDNVQKQLEADASTILLLESHSQTLEFGARRGFRTRALKHTMLRTGEGYAGRVALERKLLHVPDLRTEEGDFVRSRLFKDEEFVTYIGVPLVSKGQVEGVLEIFQRDEFEPEDEWLDFLDALAGQAAIAIDNASLYSNLERANTELSVAYDATIEGWAKALDFRDKETEGHSRRVTELTERIAREMGVESKELIHIRRGALLHDIGKLGVPDSILLKPGKLTEDEWKIMKDHPNIAHQLLSPIAYLQKALSIPYCHHEKWDGTGYPRGLKGEEIPLPARIFAVVDVWDALLSDRPYRPAWPEDKVREELKNQMGKHFDPQVVEVFLEIDWSAFAPES